MRRAPALLALPLIALASLASLAACGPTPAEPPKTESFQPTVPPGMPVLVNRGGQWLPATTVRQTGPQNVLVHYDGTPAEWDEDVLFERVRARPGAEAPAPEYKAGDTVIATSQNRMFLVEIVQQIDANTFRVHYAGFGPEVVENVTKDRLRRPFTGTTAYPVGTAVLVEAGGPQPFPGKVLALVAADQWIVRLDGLGPQYDQQVGADRIRAAALSPTPSPTVTVAPTATAAPTAAPVATPPKPPPPAPLKAGDAVLLQVRGMYYPATVVSPAANGSIRVRAAGEAADEDAAEGRVMRLPEPLKGVKYQPGAAVLVEWHGVYAVGKIVKESDPGNYKVRISGKGESDELVPVKRLRPKP